MIAAALGCDPVKQYVNVEGTYEVEVSYLSTVWQDWADKHLHLPNVPLWTSERGPIISNRIKITVTK